MPHRQTGKTIIRGSVSARLSRYLRDAGYRGGVTGTSQCLAGAGGGTRADSGGWCAAPGPILRTGESDWGCRSELAMTEPQGTVELWPCGYIARCSAPGCGRRPTTILRYLDSHGRFGHQTDACDTLAGQLCAELRVIDRKAPPRGLKGSHEAAPRRCAHPSRLVSDAAAAAFCRPSERPLQRSHRR
jgi:hypothetical protein